MIEALCLLIPIIGIGIYPKLATQTYDAKTVEVAEQARTALPLIAQQPLQQFAQPFIAPTILGSKSADLVSLAE